MEREDKNAAYGLLKEANDKLYNSMKAFQIAAQESGSLVFTYDTKTQTIFVDEKTAAAFGVEQLQPGVPYEVLKGNIVSKDTKDEYRRIHEAMIGGAAEAGGIVKLIQADGTEIVQELKFRAILDGDGKPNGFAVGIYRNITERYLKDIEWERYRQAVFASERFTFQYDFSKDLLTVYAPPKSDQGERRYQYHPFSELLEEGKICPEEDVPVVRQLLEFGAREPVQVRLYSRTTGKTRWYGLTANIVGEEKGSRRVYGLLSDITDIKEQEASYGKLQRFLKSMQEEYLGIVEVDLEKDEYTVLSYNSSRTLVGMPERGCYSQVMKATVEKIAAPEYLEQLTRFVSIEHLRETLAKERRVEIEYMTNNDGRAWRRSICQAAEYRDGVPVKATLCQMDIDRMKTEWLMQQQATMEAYRYAEAANAAKTDFLSRMSHDIRTPMNAIIGMTAIAGANLDHPERVKECLGKISTASRHLLNLINEVLDMSKIEAGAMKLVEENFNLADLIDDMIAMSLPQIKSHSHELEVETKDLKHEWVIGDSQRIQQVFMNLISNAVKYTPNGGRIRVLMREKPLPGKNFGEYEFCFEDNGIGMSEEFQKVLFEPFSRAEDSRTAKVVGTGLGMTITRNLIRMMDGDIRVESSPNQGSRFTVTIHLKFQDRDERNDQVLKDLPVLVADDDPVTRESTALLLSELGMKAERCSSGREAVRMAEKRHLEKDDYFAVLLDWRMPEMDGIATAKELRKTVGEDVPILFITAHDWSEIEDEARAAGVNRFLTKPLFKSRLSECFRELARREKESEQAEKMPIVSGDQDFSGKRVLLAEDNALNAEIAGELLKMTGASVDWADDGRKAFEMVERSPKSYYDLVLMDIQMPVLDGYGAARAIRAMEREDAKTLPIVAMTANAFTEDVNRAKDAGMNDHIAKPVDLKRLQQVLVQYLGK